MPRRQSPTLGEATDQYLSYRRARRRTKELTILSHQTTLRKLVAYLGEARRVASIRPDDIDDFMVDGVQVRLGQPGRQGRPRSFGSELAIGTLNKHRTTLSVFWQFCHDRGWTGGDERWIREAPEPDSRRDFLILTPEQLVSVYTHPSLEPVERGLIATASNTALRISELLDLRVADPRFEENRLTARIIKGRQRKPRNIELPMTAELSVELQRWLDAYREYVGDLDPDGYLFPSHARNHVGYHHWYPDRQIAGPTRIARRALRSAGIDLPEGQCWHVFRRSFANAYFRSLSDGDATYVDAIRRVQTLLNHSSSRTTELYLALDIEREARDADLAGRSFLTSQISPSADVIPFQRSTNDR